MKKWVKLGMPVLVLVGVVGYLVVLEWRKANLEENVAVRHMRMVFEDPRMSKRRAKRMFGPSGWGLGSDLKDPGPKTSQLEKLARVKTERFEYSGYDLLVEAPDSIEEKHDVKIMRYSWVKVHLFPMPRRLERLEAMPESWGGGPYDKMMRIKRTTSNEIYGMWSLPAVWDVENRLVEKMGWSGGKRRRDPMEVQGDGFVGLLTSSGHNTLRFRSLHDPIPFGQLWLLREGEMSLDDATDRFLQSMSVVRPGE